MNPTKSIVLAELALYNGDKIKLIQMYASRQIEIVNSYGGSRGDVPADPTHEFYKIEAKLQCLHSLEKGD